MTWDEVCDVALELPLVARGTYHGYPALRVRTKFLARLSDDGSSVEFKSLDPNEREMLVGMNPDVFHVPAGFGGDGIFARLAPLTEGLARDMLEQRWRRIAPRSAVAGRE